MKTLSSLLMGLGLFVFGACVPLAFGQAAPDGRAKLLFKTAEAAWHRGQWQEAVAKFKEAAATAPADEIGAEAQCHYAECLSFLTAPEIAIEEYEKVIRRHPGAPAAHEAKTGIAALKYWLGDLQTSKALFLEVARETKDWATIKECVGRLKHLQRLIDLEQNHPEILARDCGPKAFSDFCKLKGVDLKERELTRLLPVGKNGVTMEAIRRAGRAKSLKLVGARLSSDQLHLAAKPFIAHLRNHHFCVVTSTRGNRIDFIDPHGRETYTTTNRFHVLWDGTALVQEKGVAGLKREQMLSAEALKRIYGGHHLHGNEDGGCDENPASGCDGNSNCGGGQPGLPMWQVNMANYNFLIRDLVFAYDGLGPKVEFRLTYSSDSTIVSAFGRSWTHSYNIFLSENPDGVDVRRGGAKVDHFISRGDGTYTPPLWNFDELRKDTNSGTYTLKIKSTKETQSFDASGRLTSIADRNGHALTLQYEGTRLRTITDAASRVTMLNYHPNGLVSEVIDPLGRRASYIYDTSSNLVTYIDMATNVITYTYDAVTYMSSFVTPRGMWQVRRGSTPNFTDMPYILREIIDPLGQARKYDTGPLIAWYDDERTNRWFVFSEGAGETTQFTDPLGHKWRRDYFQGNPSSFSDPEGRRALYSYDNRGNRTHADPPGAPDFNYSYDSRDNLTNQTTALGRTTRYTYDAHDNLTGMINAKGHTTSFGYDGRGLLASLTDSRTNTTRFNYDARGHLAGITNPVGGVTRFTYDNVGRLSTITDPKGQQLTYTRDPLDRVTRVDAPGGLTRTFTFACCSLTAVSDSSGTVGFDVDAVGRLKHFTNNFGQVIGYEYDANGNLVGLDYPGNKVVSYQYDAANRLIAVTDWLAQTTHYTYEGSGRLLASTNSNGTVTLYRYDEGGRLSSLTHQTAMGTLLVAYKLGVDPLGNFTNIATIGGLAQQFAATNATFSYDADNRIAVGGGVTFSHDANGNLTGLSGSPATTFGYDALDRLTSVQRGAYSAQHVYDSIGQRVTRTVNGATTRYVIDPHGPLSRVLMETDGMGNPLVYYVYGMGLVTRITPAGQTHTYHFDWRGSTVALTDAAGAAVNRYAYDPWGNVATNSVEAVANSFRFVGRLGVMDDGNGLFYMRARYYMPGVGRFTSKDPAALLGGPNFYAYAMNDPLGLMDPLGLWYIDWGLSFGFGNGTGVVGGVFLGPDGVHPYAGGGVMTPGPGFSLMWSPGSPSPGCWSAQVGGGIWGGGAIGYGGGSSFWEVGFTTPGVGAVSYYTW
jgi:RHS repeat-associated protein